MGVRWKQVGTLGFYAFFAYFSLLSPAPAFAADDQPPESESTELSPSGESCSQEVASNDPKQGTIHAVKAILTELFFYGKTDGVPWKFVYGWQDYADSRDTRYTAHVDKKKKIWEELNKKWDEYGKRRDKIRESFLKDREEENKQIPLALKELYDGLEKHRRESVAEWKKQRTLSYEEWVRVQADELKAMGTTAEELWEEGFWKASRLWRVRRRAAGQALSRAGEGLRKTWNSEEYMSAMVDALQFLTHHLDELPRVRAEERETRQALLNKGKEAQQLDLSYREFVGKTERAGFQVLALANLLARRAGEVPARAIAGGAGYGMAYAGKGVGKGSVLFFKTGVAGAQWAILIAKDGVLFAGRSASHTLGAGIVAFAMPFYVVADDIATSLRYAFSVARGATGNAAWKGVNLFLTDLAHTWMDTFTAGWTVCHWTATATRFGFAAGGAFGRLLRIAGRNAGYRTRNFFEGGVSAGTSGGAVAVYSTVGALTLVRDLAAFPFKFASNLVFPKLRRTLDLGVDITTTEEFSRVGEMALQIQAAFKDRFQTKITGRGGGHGSNVELYDKDNSRWAGTITVTVQSKKLIAEVTVPRGYAVQLVGNGNTDGFMQDLDSQIPRWVSE